MVAPGHLLKLVPQSHAVVVQAFVDLWRKLMHGRQASLHGHGIGVERTTMRNAWGLLRGIKRLHDVSPATESAYWEPATDDFPHAGQIRDDVKPPLCPSWSHP